jgi:hypothetical protein
MKGARCKVQGTRHKEIGNRKEERDPAFALISFGRQAEGEKVRIN